jgi:ubiquinone/menaquinone biosynthesis C-methylase UbiE
MTQAVTLSKVQNLLDVGAGAGHTAIAFANIADQCVGIDVTKQMVDTAT